VVEFYDIAGIVKGAHKGEGLGNKFLSHIKEAQVLITVLRNFEDDSIINIENTVNPIRDWEVLQIELSLKDLEAVDKRLVSLDKESRGNNSETLRNINILKSVKRLLESGNRPDAFSEEKIVKDLQLLSLKKNLILLNGLSRNQKSIEEYFNAKSLEIISVDLASTSVLNSLITRCYAMLNLISYFTTGEDETRAWTITRGMTIPQAAGQIHSEFENYFIKAEVVSFIKLIEAGSWSRAKQNGWVRLEGKEYVVEDGDVIIVRHG